MLIMTREKAKKLGLKPIASFVSFGVAGVPPDLMGAGPVPSSRKALEFAGLKAKDIDVWEINEAFSVVSLYAIKELGIDPEKVNIHGGAVAIGHPLGATGIRLVGTTARILKERKGKYGLGTQCCGGGQGVAAIIKAE
jgi:acetyl-CoA C-acetyltransferase